MMTSSLSPANCEDIPMKVYNKIAMMSVISK